MMAARFPLEPLLRAAGIEQIHDGEEGGQQPDQRLAGLALLATRLEISHRMARYLLHGRPSRPSSMCGLTEWQADRYAVKLGLLPWEVWPDWCSEAPGEDDLRARPCRCRLEERQPVGDECDRCGGALRPAVSKEGHADAA
jgi:hypothetical protein